MNSSQQLVAPLACMATGITFFLGFTPIAKVPIRFFSLHSAIAGFIWFVVFLHSQNSIYLILSVGCAFAWQKFRSNKVPTGKMFLALASGLGVGFALFRSGLILPPPLLPAIWSNFWTLSVLFSAAVLGSCYLALMTGSDFKRKSVTRETFERSLYIFLTTLALRAVLFFVMTATVWLGEISDVREQWFTYDKTGVQLLFRLIFGLVLPALIAFWGLAQLKRPSSTFKFAPFYALVFLVLGGEIYAFKIGF